MAAKKGQPKKGGRKPGTPNRVTASVKDALMEAFDGIGGVPKLIEWAQRSGANRREFYKIWSKLLPKEITGLGGGPLSVAVVNLRSLPDADLDTLDAILDRATAEPADPGGGESGEGPPPPEPVRSAGVADPEPGPAA